MKPIPLLVNAAARISKKGAFHAWLDNNHKAFRIIRPGSPEEMSDYCSRLAREGTPLVAVAGGDGTLARAAQGLAGTATELAVMPSGTMNVFAREIGIGSHNFDAALAAIRQGETREIDIFEINGTPFIQMAGFGPDARAVQLTTPHTKRKWGPLAYGFSGLKACMEHHPELTLRLPDGSACRGHAILLGNGSLYGGSMKLFRHATNSDGILDAIVFHSDSASMVYQIVKSLLFRGLHPDRHCAEYTYLRIESASIESAAPVPYEMDGDYSGTHASGQSTRITRAPGSLKVRVLNRL